MQFVAGKQVLSPTPPFVPLAQSLPFELLSEIFSICLHNFSSDSDSLRPDHPPWTFAKVCRHWRAVCLSSPLLWVRFPRLNTNSENSRNDAFRGLLRTSLELSNPAPYKLHLTTYSHPDQDWELPPLLSDLLPYIDRCEELTIAMNEYIIEKLHQLQWKLNTLCILSLRFYGPSRDFDTGSTPKLTIFDKDVPCLESVTVELVPHSSSYHFTIPTLFKFDYIRLPWGQLTSFSAIYFSNHSALEALRNAPMLRECSFTGMWDAPLPSITVSETSANPLQPVIHRRLRSLALQKIGAVFGGDINPFPTFLSQLTAPKLLKLKITVGLLREHYAAHVLAFIERSSCSLISLTLHAENARHHLTQILSLIPRLRDLEICYIGSDDLSKIRLQGSDPLIPHLRHLTLIKPSVKADDLDFFISSRTDNTLFGTPDLPSSPPHGPSWEISPQPLESLVIHFADEPKHSFERDDRTRRAIHYELEGWDGMPRQDQAFQRVLTWKRSLEALELQMKSTGSENSERVLESVQLII
ncbi:hypothetical protein BDN70DRAFT_48545 [Pholiota conissans]|uniref:F-box domain-containing protein n=1 Tax=Pholiota conissans TaxID=109636 RepID=A0A9P6D072_9AGAR|nr:hypothetical protein BDN70DRAFT_48545 [Pholiota conissans]